MTKKFFTFILALISVLTFIPESSSLAASKVKYGMDKDIAYRSEKDAYIASQCRLDVYYPKKAENAPVVVWFHGGGLTKGKKYVPEELEESGIIVVAVGYRFMDKVHISDCIDDAAASVAWTFANIGKYGGAKDRIFVSGHSAGGYLTNMLGLDRKWLAKYGIDANSLAGLMPLSGQAITHYELRKQQGIGPLQATIDEYAPLTYARGDAAPMLIVSGDRELEMNGRYEEQAYFWRMLKLNGMKDVSIYEMQGYNHSQMRHPAMHLVKKFISDHTK